MCPIHNSLGAMGILNVVHAHSKHEHVYASQHYMLFTDKAHFTHDGISNI